MSDTPSWEALSTTMISVDIPYAAARRDSRQCRSKSRQFQLAMQIESSISAIPAAVNPRLHHAGTKRRRHSRHAAVRQDTFRCSIRVHRDKQPELMRERNWDDWEAA